MRRPRILDYYRQFEALDPQEHSQRLKARRDEERSRELELAPVVDLSRPDWHEPPDPELVNAATFALRRAINRYPEAQGGPAVEAIAAHLGLDPDRIALGHGAAQLIQAAVRRLAVGGSLLVPWPSWSPLPALAARTGARPVFVECPGGFDPERVAAAAATEDDVRAVAVCSPNDPTGELVSAAQLRALAELTPAGTAILLDEALVEFAAPAASLTPLVDEIPSLIVFRSFSKAWALAGLRAGYAVAGEQAAEIVAELSPGLGVSQPAQAAMAAALEPGGKPLRRLERRAKAVAAERERLIRLLDDSAYELAPTRAHVVWLGHAELDGSDLAHELAERRLVVAPGSEWGDSRRVRITLRDRASTERLVSALRELG